MGRRRVGMKREVCMIKLVLYVCLRRSRVKPAAFFTVGCAVRDYETASIACIT